MIKVNIVGGPFDGYQHRFGGDMAALQHDLIWLVCDDAFSQCGYRFATQHDQITHIAVYSLDKDVTSMSYRFVRFISPQDFYSALESIQPISSSVPMFQRAESSVG